MERQVVAKVQKSPTPISHLQTKSAYSASTSHPLLELQSSIGNQAVQRLIRSGYIQTKLKISTPGDPFEQEADRVADTVMRMPDPAGAESVQTKPLAPRITTLVQRQAEQPVADEEEKTLVSPTLQRVPLAVREDDEEEKLATKLDDVQPEDEKEKPVQAKFTSDLPVQRQAVKDEETEEEGPELMSPIQRQMEEEEEDLQTKLWAVQRKPIAGIHSIARRLSNQAVQRACTECEQEKSKHSGEPSHLVHRLRRAGQPHVNALEESVQPKTAPSANSRSTVSLAANVRALNGGSPLPPATRAFFEPRFGANFSQVRIHTDSRAAETASAINARAFTVGRNIAFGAGQYAPESGEGKNILAHELTHVVQQGGAPGGSASGIQRVEESVQRFPQAGEILPSTEKQARYYDHRNEVVDIAGESMFKPDVGLAKYIASLWENSQDAPVNIKFGSLASGFIFVKPKDYVVRQRCSTDPLGLVRFCVDAPPEATNYEAQLQTIPLKHRAFEETEKGSLVLLVGIVSGVLFGKLAWMEGKKEDQIHPFAFQEAMTSFDETAFLPLIYGDQYDGKNYTSTKYLNKFEDGKLTFYSIGELEIANQQKIQGGLGLLNFFSVWEGKLKGKPIGLEEYEFPIDRNPKAELHGEDSSLVLDKEWLSGDTAGEDGVFTQGQLRISYKNGTVEIFGKATYASKRIKGEVNIAVTTESEAQELFAQNAPAEKVQAAAATLPTIPEEGSKEPLALTAWGNLTFKLIDKAAPVKGAPATPKGQKAPPEDLEGEGAFAVSPEGYIILSGKLKLPAKWLFTDAYDYTSTDADDKSKHLFEKHTTEARAPVPYGTVGLKLGIQVDAYAHLDPLELYEVEITGVYSNHPQYRSEVDVTPHFYISGYAGATVTVIAEGAYRLFGVFKVGSVTGTLKGDARADAYVEASPSVKKIWKDADSPAAYAIAGAIHSGGKLTFSLSGSITIDVLKAEIWKSGEYHIGSWTIGSFGLGVILDEYVIGSGDKPKLNYKSIGFDEKQRQSLGTAIAKEKEAEEGSDKRTGGFTQIEGGKPVEKGTFTTTPPTREDLGKQEIKNVLEEDFVMQDKLHELVLTFGGTRDAPTALIEMASNGKKPLEEKIAEEKTILSYEKLVADDDTEKQIEQQEHDLEAIDKEAKSVKKNAEGAAQKVQPGEEPAVAGFDRLDDRISSYAKKHGTNDLGFGAAPLATKPTTAAAAALRVPKSTGASSEMEQRLADERTKVGYESFDDFRGSNVAVFRYYVLKPGSFGITPSTIAGGPFIEFAINTKRGLHSEVVILGKLQKMHKTKKFRKKYGPDYIIAVDQVLSERSPCSQCRGSLGQKSSLITTSNYHNYYLVHYSGDWIERNRSLMIKYGLEPPPLADLRKLFGRGDADPH